VQNKGAQKVLFVADHIGQLHGSALSAHDILRSIPSSYKKYLLSPYKPDQCADIELSFSLQPLTKFLSSNKLGKAALRFLPRSVVSLADSFCLKAIFWHFSFDLVIVNGYGSASTWRQICTILPPKTKPVVVSRESPRHFEFGDINVRLESQIEFLRGFRSHIFVSSRLKNEWIEIANLERARCFYLPNCCAEEKFIHLSRDKKAKLDSRLELGIPSNTVLLLNVGTLELRKGQQDLVELGIRLKKDGIDFTVGCIGFPHGPEGMRLQKAVSHAGLEDHFLLPGPSEAIASWFTAADFLVFTSRAEAMPRTILEAMAAALPIISTNVDGIPELISSDDTGLLYMPGNIDMLERLVLLSIDNHEASTARGFNARNLYKKDFSQAHHARKLAQIVRSISNTEA
jgi:glycosyltransferase involved in cell wall biosynthesis